MENLKIGETYELFFENKNGVFGDTVSVSPQDGYGLVRTVRVIDLDLDDESVKLVWSERDDEPLGWFELV